MRSGYLEHMQRAEQLAKEMMQVAAQGEAFCEDDPCLLVYGVILDCAFKIRKTVEEQAHKGDTDPRLMSLSGC